MVTHATQWISILTKPILIKLSQTLIEKSTPGGTATCDKTLRGGCRVCVCEHLPMLVPVEASSRLWIASTTVPGLYVGSGYPNSGVMLAWQGLHHWAISPALLHLLSQTHQKVKPSIQSFIVSFEFSMSKSMEVLWERPPSLESHRSSRRKGSQPPRPPSFPTP